MVTTDGVSTAEGDRASQAVVPAWSSLRRTRAAQKHSSLHARKHSDQVMEGVGDS